MVLENSTTPDSFGDDGDRYAPRDDGGRSGVPAGYSQFDIDASRLAQPLPVLGPLLGYNAAYQQMELRRHVTAAGALVRRPLTDAEAQAHAEVTAKRIAMRSYNEVAGIAAGSYAAYSSRETWKYPFVKMDLSKVNLEQFPHRYPVLRGSQALMMRHFTRYGLYALVGAFISMGFGDIWVMSLSVADAARDPRLEDWRRDFQRAAEQMRHERMRGGLPRPSAATPSSSGAGDHAPSGERRPPPAWKPAPAVDDASPTAGHDGLDSVFGGWGDEARDQPPSSPPPPQQQAGSANRWGTPNSSSSSAQRADDDDAASPTASSASSEGSGSAWEQIRRQAQQAQANADGSHPISSWPAGQRRDES